MGGGQLSHRTMRKRFRDFFQLIQPAWLGAGILVTALGGGTAHALSYPIDWKIYGLGQAWVTTLQLASLFLFKAFSENFQAESGNMVERQRRMWAIISGVWVGFSAITALTVLLQLNRSLTLEVGFILGLLLAGGLMYGLPPFRLAYSGYGEIVHSFALTILGPALAFMLQARPMHRFVIMASLPVFLAYTALLLAFEVISFNDDIRHVKLTLLVRMDWKKGMLLHNILVILVFLAIGLAAIFGFPRFGVISGLALLPLGVFQIWQMRRIEEGKKPQWGFLRFSAIFLFAMLGYLFTYGFWILD